jgi:hypothetical protein
MKSPLSLVFCVICSTAMAQLKPAAAIDELVTHFAKAPLWGDRLYPVVRLEKSATPEEVIRAYCGKSHWDTYLVVRKFSIVQTKEVKIGDPPRDLYRAVYCQADGVDRVFLIQYEEATSHWWVRPFKVPVEGKDSGKLDPVAKVMLGKLEQVVIPSVSMNGSGIEESFDYASYLLSQNTPEAKELAKEQEKAPQKTTFLAPIRWQWARRYEEPAGEGLGLRSGDLEEGPIRRVVYEAENVKLLDLVAEIARQCRLDAYVTSEGFKLVAEGKPPVVDHGEVWKIVRSKVAYEAKSLLETGIVPVVDADNTSVDELIDFLRLRAAEVGDESPEKKGICFVERMPRAAEEGPAPVGLPLSEKELEALPRLTLSMKDATFGAVLKEMARRAKLDLYLTTGGVLMRPAGKAPFANEKEEAAGLVERYYRHGAAGK